MMTRHVSAATSKQLKAIGAGVVLVSLAAFVGPFSAPSTCDARTATPLVSTGLKNLGNTCYMNAQLQCAFHIPAVREIIMSQDAPPVSEDAAFATTDAIITPPRHPNEALSATKELFDGMIHSAQTKSPAYSPKSFCFRLGIPPMVQQDSQEFWKLLLPAIGSEELSDLYKGVHVDYITALDGSGKERRRDEVYLDLSLDVSDNSDLVSSLQKDFGEPELLSVSEGNGWRPEEGADKVDAHKGSSIVAEGLPPLLQFHLKRFHYDWQTDKTTKINKRFVFPEELDLSPLCSGMTKGAEDLVKYVLQSVVVHVGEYGVGHYYSYVRPDIENDSWYRFNDDIVEKVSFQEVVDDVYGGCKQSHVHSLRQGHGSGIVQVMRNLFKRSVSNLYGWGGETSNAYVIQYIRRKDIPFLYRQSP
jgi:ubiquitin carboxyl-terminal hydrolase 7